jgi:hemerythrin-like domain-containing protein
MWKNRLLSRVGASGKSSRSHPAVEAFISNETIRMAKPLIRLPDPLEFSDPIKYLRASHVVIVAQVELLHTLVKEAEQQGVSKSFSTHPDWVSSLYFFSRVLPIHERDEEIAIFPLLIANLTHVGFLPADSPIRFLEDSHAGMEQQAETLVRTWQRHVDASGRRETVMSKDEEHAFLDSALQLVDLLRKHVTMEDELVYKQAHDILSPTERINAMNLIRKNHHAVVHSGVQEYDAPTSSLPTGSYVYTSPTHSSESQGGEDIDAISEIELPREADEGAEEEQEE